MRRLSVSLLFDESILYGPSLRTKEMPVHDQTKVVFHARVDVLTFQHIDLESTSGGDPSSPIRTASLRSETFL